MGIYREYLDGPVARDFQALTVERKAQLSRISSLRDGRATLVVAADMGSPVPLPTGLSFEDRLPIYDLLSDLSGDSLDLILEIPGGLGDVAEEIVRTIRKKFQRFSVIIPGWAKSAGTIMSMAADEILMSPTAALGPIDAQISWQGKQFSAGELIDAFQKIKDEVQSNGSLNKAYIPVLQGISPGELQHAQNGLDFAKRLVGDWLAKYKFQGWTHHGSDGREVTDEDRKNRAAAVAAKLCDHGCWLTHGRSIRMADLRDMRLEIMDFTEQGDLGDAISRYYALLQMTFATNIYKLYETPQSQILKFFNPQTQTAPQQLQKVDSVVANVTCSKCGNSMKIQANFERPHPTQTGCVPFPKSNKIRCSKCHTEMDLTALRVKLQAEAKRPVV